ncbi:MAG TPA: hypothetical protein VFN32_13905 [Rhodococcus sp. (in: high G+C Gram-positive bacteria)]|jgi:hypothetical protein|nr:hypothetical protein [Rhodococcus sp. (in: high G+C Gram-positive bacteria)]
MGDPQVVTRTQLIEAGTSAFEIARELQRGGLVRIAHGRYLHRGDFDALDEIGRHRVLARHIGSTLGPGNALSHVSASILHGAPVWNIPLVRVHVSRGAGEEARRRAWIHTHVAQWAEADLTIVDGVPVTSVARTIADLARSVPKPHAVAIGDALLRIDPDAASALPSVVDAAMGLHGVGRARAVVGFLDARSESVGESLSDASSERGPVEGGNDGMCSIFRYTNQHF